MKTIIMALLAIALVTTANAAPIVDQLSNGQWILVNDDNTWTEIVSETDHTPVDKYGKAIPGRMVASNMPKLKIEYVKRSGDYVKVGLNAPFPGTVTCVAYKGRQAVGINDWHITSAGYVEALVKDNGQATTANCKYK